MEARLPAGVPVLSGGRLLLPADLRDDRTRIGPQRRAQGRPASALANVFGSFNGTPKVGDDVYTTLDPKAQALARQLLHATMASTGAISGSVVAIVPQTGAVKVMYSSPTYNNNDPNQQVQAPGCSQYFNAPQGAYPPGSTFKLVTTTAALDSGRYTPYSLFNGNSPVTVSGHSLENDGNASYGQVTLTKALTDSINTVYAPLGVTLGRRPDAEVHEALRLLFGAAARLSRRARCWRAASTPRRQQAEAAPGHQPHASTSAARRSARRILR